MVGVSGLLCSIAGVVSGATGPSASVIRGKRRDLGIGPVDEVSLAEAREIAEKNQKIARRGGDPCAEAAHEKGATFAEMYEVVTENRSKNWETPGTRAAWVRMFEHDILPTIGPMPVDDITIKDIRDLVEPDWNGRGSKGIFGEAEYRVRLRLGGREWVIALTIRRQSSRPSCRPWRRIVKHHPSLPYREAPAALVEWQELADKEACQVGRALHDSHGRAPF